jgi:hypothetical protein
VVTWSDLVTREKPFVSDYMVEVYLQVDETNLPFLSIPNCDVQRLFARSNGCDLLCSVFVELMASFMLCRMILWSTTIAPRCPMISTGMNLKVKCFL